MNVNLKEQIKTSITVLENILLKLDNKIINSQIINKGDEIKYNYFELQKKILQIEFNLDVYEGKNNTILSNERILLKKIKNNIEIIKNYNTIINQHKQKNTIHYLALIGFIFIPLQAITGYFGMNFINMGIDIKSKIGIYSIKNPNLFLGFLFIISIIGSTFIYFKSKKNSLTYDNSY